MKDFFKTRIDYAVVVTIVIFFCAGFYLGSADNADVLNFKSKQVDPNTVDMAPFWKTWSLIDEKYPGASAVTNQERVYGAINGLVGSVGDPYTTFFKPDEKKLFEDTIAGNFSGVGMEVGIKDKILTVVAPLKDTPAYKAGIKSGDKILKIDSKLTSDLRIDEAIKLIRGDRGTTVTLTIFREGDKEPREIKIVRDIIEEPTLDTELRADGIFVIKLYSFSANSSDLFRKAMKKFTESKTDKLLLDLRGNPGGYLDSAVEISSWFLPAGKSVVIEDYGNGKKEKVFRSAGYDLFTDDLKFVILIDGGSASASEIVAGAMQDYKKAKLVGEKSYGKGSVQEVVDVTPDTILKITVAKWLTPTNRHLIAESGLVPDYVVPFTRGDAENKKDPQMDKAVEILLK